MAKAVGLSRAIKPEWTNRTVQLVLEGMTAENIKAALDDYLSFELSDPTNISKARNILMNMWVRPFEDAKKDAIRRDALKLYQDADQKAVLDWCMLLLAYPIFVEWTSILGKIKRMQDSFSASWLKEKIFEERGEKTTLLYATEKILQTSRQLGIIEPQGRGNYAFKEIRVDDERIVLVLARAIVALKTNAYYEVSDIVNAPQLFPFIFDLTSELVYGQDAFEVASFGSSSVIVDIK